MDNGVLSLDDLLDMTQEEFKLGKLEKGKIILEKEFDLKLKDPFGCFAHNIKA